MRLPLAAALLLPAACYDTPAWFGLCDCGDNLCVRDGDAFECMLVPESCSAAYFGECDPSLLDRPCAVDVCGEFQGEWEFVLDCQARGRRVYRFADCTDVGTDRP